MSYPAYACSARKLLLVSLVLFFAVPAICATHWTQFGPDNVVVRLARADRSNPQIIYVASDRGAFVTRDGGIHWEAASNGLHSCVILTLAQAQNGTWVAGTDHGIFLLASGSDVWRPSNTVVNEQGTPRVIHVNGITRHVMAHHPTRTNLQARVNDIEVAPNRWLAATSAGLFSSSDQGKIWSGGPANGEKDFVAIRAEKELVVAATPSRLLVSVDGGTVWKQANVSCGHDPASEVVISPDLRIFVATPDGVFRSADGGSRWERLRGGLPSGAIGSIAFDGTSNRLLAVSSGSGAIYESVDKGQNWNQVANAGAEVQSVVTLNGRLFANTPAGILAGPPKLEDDSSEANRGRSNWFLRLVHHSQ